MNDIFSLQRLGWYARKEFYENWKLYVLAILAMLAWFGYTYYAIFNGIKYAILSDSDSSNLSNIYNAGRRNALIPSLVVGICLVAGHAFHQFTTKSKTLTTLLLPVSVLERLVFAILLSLPVFLLVVIGFWAGLDVVVRPFFASKFAHLHQFTAISSISDFYSKEVFKYDALPAVGALCMLGAVTLGRLNIFKTTAILLLFAWFVFFKLHQYWHDWLLADFKGQNLIFESTYVLITDFWWVFAMPVLLWVATYFKIKEKEA
jgi:hypothetical protein